MAWEIERRFLVQVPETFWDQLGEEHHYRQGYIRNGEPSLRIRVGEPRGPVLTSKSGSGARRSEVEVVVPQEMAIPLLEAAEKRVIEKIRWRIGPWELDRFLGPLEGLVLMEIELDHETDPIPTPPNGIHVLREVTDDKKFVSSHLARLKHDAQRKLVKKAYKEAKIWTGSPD